MVSFTSTSPLPDGFLGQGYNHQLQVVGVTGTASFTLTGGLFPDGLAINDSEGTIFGTANAIETATFTILVEDDDSSDEAEFQIEILPALSITTTELPAGVVGEPYEATVEATSGVPPYNWGIAGSVPVWFNIDASTGVISGTPDAASDGTVTIVVVDSNVDGETGTDTQEFTLTVTEESACVPRVEAETVATLITRVRDELGDPIVDPQGNTITSPAYTITHIRNALNDTMIELGRMLRLGHRGEALQAVELTYTEDSTRRGVDLPDGVLVSAIFEVEDVVSSSIQQPRPLTYVAMTEISRYDRNVEDIRTFPYYYTLHVEEENYRIMIRPQPDAGRVFRIWYAATPLVTCDDDESLPLAAEWRELIGIMAARKLLSRNGELTADLKERYLEQMEQFKQFATRNKGPQRVRNVNRGIF